MDFLSERAIIELINDTIWIKPLDYYDKMLNYSRKELSQYCLTYIEDPRWNNVPNGSKIIFDGWVIYKEHLNDVKIGSDQWFLEQSENKFEITDLCSRSIFYNKN